MRCDDPKCGCQPAPKKSLIPPRIELVVRGSQPEQICQVDRPDADLDVVFDLIFNIMILRETIHDPERRNTARVTYLLINSQNVRFINLNGLADNSLLLSLRVKSSACSAEGNKMLMRSKYFGFAPVHLESRLYTDMYLCDWPEQTIQLLLPAQRIRGWKTVALVLKTFERITPENWSNLIDMTNVPDVAGLDWRAIEKEIWPDESKSLKIDEVKKLLKAAV